MHAMLHSQHDIVMLIDDEMIEQWLCQLITKVIIFSERHDSRLELILIFNQHNCLWVVVCHNISDFIFCCFVDFVNINHIWREIKVEYWIVDDSQYAQNNISISENVCMKLIDLINHYFIFIERHQMIIFKIQQVIFELCINAFRVCVQQIHKITDL